jgi:hypothetical protein
MAASAGAAPSFDAVLDAAFPASDGLAGHLRRAVACHLLQKQLDGAAGRSRFVPESPPCTHTKALCGARGGHSWQSTRRGPCLASL